MQSMEPPELNLSAGDAQPLQMQEDPTENTTETPTVENGPDNSGESAEGENTTESTTEEAQPAHAPPAIPESELMALVRRSCSLVERLRSVSPYAAAA